MERLRPLCPYLNRRDARCAARLTLTNLREAFHLCAGNHESCRVYHDIRDDDLRAGRERYIARSA